MKPCPNTHFGSSISAVQNDVTTVMNVVDAIYVRDFTRWGELEAERLALTAAILNDVYGAYDLAHHALASGDVGLGARAG